MQLNTEPTMQVTPEESSQSHFIYDSNFTLLRQLQQEIFQLTDVSPSIRKIVNQLITQENLQLIKMHYLTRYQ